MVISWHKRENGELVEKWRFQMGGRYARAIETDLRYEEKRRKWAAQDRKRAEKRAEKRAQKEAKRPLTDLEKQAVERAKEMANFERAVEEYDGTVN